LLTLFALNITNRNVVQATHSQWPISGYLYTFSKNKVISSVQKRYCAFGLELGLRLGLGVSENIFSLKGIFKQV